MGRLEVVSIMDKKERKAISLKKVSIISEIEGGKKQADVGQKFGISKKTVIIWRNRETLALKHQHESPDLRLFMG